MKLTDKELKAVLTISLIIALRLLGIFLILPVFSIYTVQYPGASLSLAGVAFGIYALTQSIFQIPFGIASDRYGRKKVLILGLLLFSVGSLLCAFSENIIELIAARAIQGCGAVGAVAIASLGDSTRSEVRAQSFTITGIIVGIAFIISLVVGPAIASKFGFSSLFLVLTFLGLIATVITFISFPNLKISDQEKTSLNLLSRLREVEIRKLFIATFIVSFILNLFLFIFPLSWKAINFDFDKFWLVYLIIILPATIFVYPYIRRTEKTGNLDFPVYLGFSFIGLSLLIYLFTSFAQFGLYTSGILFFIGHSLFQSLLLTFLTQRFPSGNRGASSGLYNLSNFMGAAIGGMIAGKLYETSNYLPLVICLIVMVLWFLLGVPKSPATKR